MELIHSICECLSLQLVPSAPSALSLWEPAWQIRIAGPLLALHTNFKSALSPATMFWTNSSQRARHHNTSNNNLMKIVTKLAHCLLSAFRHVMYIIMLLVSQRWSWGRSHCWSSWSPSSPSSLPPPSTRSTPSRRTHCQQDDPSPGPITPLTGSPTRWGTTSTNDGRVSDDNRR